MYKFTSERPRGLLFFHPTKTGYVETTLKELNKMTYIFLDFGTNLLPTLEEDFPKGKADLCYTIYNNNSILYFLSRSLDTANPPHNVWSVDRHLFLQHGERWDTDVQPSEAVCRARHLLCVHTNHGPSACL